MRFLGLEYFFANLRKIAERNEVVSKKFNGRARKDMNIVTSVAIAIATLHRYSLAVSVVLPFLQVQRTTLDQSV